jgi:hypothetical protein
MLIGFGKQDITPRLGVELYGYSGYLNRYGTAVRDRLCARSMAVSDGDQVAVVVSCDLVFITRELTTEVRRLIREETGLVEANVMVHATHTHSGPCLKLDYHNAYDPPFMDMLPRRIAQSCIDAVKSMQEAELHHAEVPCEGMATNRVYDKFSYGEAALEDDFRPAKPELTDTTCHVLKAVAQKRVLGFVSYFGCHNVVGGPECTYIHGDYAGIATGMLEREHPGSVGLFLQGAEGDVNSATCCLGNDSVLAALDIMASRYARAVRHGLAVAEPLDVDTVRVSRRQASFSITQIPLDELRERLAEEESVMDNPDVDDSDQDYRWAVMRSMALRSIIDRVERGVSFEDTTELHGIRIGPVALLGTPFEVFQAIARETAREAKAPIPLVLSFANDEQGYAVDRTTAQDESDYAARTVPLWKHTLPYADVHTELVAGLLAVDAELAAT